MTIHALLADWGTSALRVWGVDAGGHPLAFRDKPLGVASLKRESLEQVFELEARAAMGAPAAPALLCGMVGSDLGWMRAPYVPCPATLESIAEGCITPPRARAPSVIVPGLSCAGIFGTGDVLRGEETQLAGLLASESELADAVVCMPGTHTKWVHVEDRVIRGFATAMTGELYALLSGGSTLATLDSAPDQEAFDAGLAAAGDGDILAARLFGARVRKVLHGQHEGGASFLSGVLIGAEVAGMLEHFPSQTCIVVGRTALASSYAQALSARGINAAVRDGDAMSLAGLVALAKARSLL